MHQRGSDGAHACRAIRREHLFLGELVIRDLPRMLSLSPTDALHQYYHDRPVLSCDAISRPDLTFVLPNFLIVVEFDESGHTDRTTYGELRHLEIIHDWAKKTHGLQYMYVLRIDERGLFRRAHSGGHTGHAPQPREPVWVPTGLFPQCLQAVAERLGERMKQALCASGRVPVELLGPLAACVETWDRTNGLRRAP